MLKDPPTDRESFTVWLTERQVAERLNMSLKWVQTQRLHGRGPRYAKFNSAVRYSLTDIITFERESLRTSTSDSGPQGGQS